MVSIGVPIAFELDITSDKFGDLPVLLLKSMFLPKILTQYAHLEDKELDEIYMAPE
jgi:hypothetical protein